MRGAIERHTIYIDDETVVTSPSDLSTWAACEWAFLRRLDAKLGRIDPIADAADSMLDRTARLGDDHEIRFLEQLRRTHEVVEFERPDRADYPAAADAAERALRDGAPVLYQATFFDGTFIGFSDFLIRTDDGAYEVYDTKLARHAKIPALLQLAAYAEQIAARGVAVGPLVHLVLGDGATSSHELADIAPVYRAQRDRLRAAVEERRRAEGALAWGAPGVRACGRCGPCAEQVDEHRDLVLVAGLTLGQRTSLIDAGIASIDALAASTGPVAGVGSTALARLRGQAELQIASEHGSAPEIRLVDAGALAAIPAPDPGDVFFDFEGDPLYTEGDGTVWGLDYLFGLVDDQARFTAFWAHDLRDERRALIDFLAYVRERRAAHPGMHVYHYASYERSHLLSLAARHGVGEDDVDDLLRDGVLVDLYPIVRKALLVGSRSYSIKKLEPLYMGADLRDDGGVVTATDSIDAYVEAAAALRAGDPSGQARLDQVADYNEYDCRSTLRLRDWLLAFAPAGSSTDGTLDLVDDERVRAEPDPVFVELSAQLADVDPLDRTPDQTALALAAAAIDYHRREAKTFWQEHFDRLRNPIDEWADARDVFVVDRAEVVRDWQRPPRKRTLSRDLRLVGSLAPGSRLPIGASPMVVYDTPLPASANRAGPGSRGWAARGTVVDAETDGRRVVLLLTETVPVGAETHDAFPVALTPAAPPRAAPQPAAISEWGRRVLDGLPGLVADAALDLLRRVPPRGRVVPVEGDDTVAAVTATLLGLDRSYLAVQGLPAQARPSSGRPSSPGSSASTAGGSASSASRTRSSRTSSRPWSARGRPRARGQGAEERRRPRGGRGGRLDGRQERRRARRVPHRTGRDRGVVGGTAWTFANADTIARGSLDLLVIDEAGQFSLAPTIASSVAAQRLLLLGDPQQLPQVSQGSHPEPVDRSALGWLADGHDVLPPELGYFLSRTYRMHPALTAPVSRLSYDGALASRAPERHLEGIAPGLHVEAVRHHGNTTSSPEEAERVVALVADVVGRRWTDGDGRTRALTDDDVIVVAPYNAHGAVVRAALDAAGFRGTTVGTVDLFQGGGRRRDPLAGRVERRRHPPGARVPAPAEPAQRRDLARPVGGIPGALARAGRLDADDDRRSRPALAVHRPRRARRAPRFALGSTHGDLLAQEAHVRRRHRRGTGRHPDAVPGPAADRPGGPRRARRSRVRTRGARPRDPRRAGDARDRRLRPARARAPCGGTRRAHVPAGGAGRLGREEEHPDHVLGHQGARGGRSAARHRVVVDRRPHGRTAEGRHDLDRPPGRQQRQEGAARLHQRRPAGLLPQDPRPRLAGGVGAGGRRDGDLEVRRPRARPRLARDPVDRLHRRARHRPHGRPGREHAGQARHGREADPVDHDARDAARRPGALHRGPRRGGRRGRPDVRRRRHGDVERRRHLLGAAHLPGRGRRLGPDGPSPGDAPRSHREGRDRSRARGHRRQPRRIHADRHGRRAARPPRLGLAPPPRGATGGRLPGDGRHVATLGAVGAFG
nr:hypothetical protein GCM10025699_55840 [Microbacterium flavescens]